MSTSTDYFGQHEFIAERVAEFLSVPGLCKFGATNKTHQKIFRAEVQRRKKEFAELEATFRSLMPSSRANILQAKKVFDKAKRLIDSGLSWLDRRNPERFVTQDELFEDERKRFCEGETHFGQPYFSMLPLCFYMNTASQSAEPPSKVSSKLLARCQKQVTQLWGAEDHMGFFYEMYGDDDYYSDPKHPFRKFENDHAQFFVEFLLETIDELRETPSGVMDAFRVAARQQANRTKGAQDFLHFILHHVDHCDDDSDEE